MRRLFPVAVTTAAFAATTLLLSAGSAGAAGNQVRHARTAPVRQSPDVVVSWHQLHLINGWAEARGPSFPVGNAAYSVINGVVYLTGGIKRASGTKDVFAVLPKAARPAHYTYLPVISLGTMSAAVEIWPSGQIWALDGDAAGYTSLDGISYPAAGTRWHRLALTTHWKSAQREFGSGDPAYTLRGGIVYLSGSAIGKSPAGDGLATLPPGARPKYNLYIRTYTAGGVVGTLAILPDGAILAYGARSRLFLSLAGVSFPNAKFKWHKIALTGWQSEQSLSGTGDPAYGIAGPIVYLNGSMGQTTGSIIFAATPAAIRPKHELNIEVYTNLSTYGQIQITKPSLYVESVPAIDAEDFTSLAGVSYPLSS
jgi:hypothetical protein